MVYPTRPVGIVGAQVLKGGGGGGGGTPISYDASSSKNGAGSPGSPWTWTHTPVGSPSKVLVGIFLASGETVSAVSYGGTALSLVGTATGGGWTMAVYGKAGGLPSGAQTISITHNNAAFIGAGAMTFVDGDTGTLASASSFTSGATGGDPMDGTVASAAGELVAQFWTTENLNGAGITIVAPSAMRFDNYTASGPGPGNLAGATRAGAASVTIGWTPDFDSSASWAAGTLSLP